MVSGVRTLTLALSLCLALVTTLAAQETNSLIATDIDKAEKAIALGSALAENKSLKEKLAAVEGVVSSLQKSLAAKTTEAESCRRKAGELTVRLEALGTGNLDDRVIKLLNDLKIAEDERSKLRSALIGVSEAVLRYNKVSLSSDAAVRLDLEAAMRESAKVLGINAPDAVNASPEPSTLTDGMVVSIKEDLNLVVANIGSRQGVKIGMPFDVVRGDNVVGSVRIVDVREKIAGGLIQYLNDRERIKTGDRLKIASQQ
jgi:hypothetical protein